MLYYSSIHIRVVTVLGTYTRQTTEGPCYTSTEAEIQTRCQWGTSAI